MGNLPSVEISTLETQSLVLTEAHTSPTCYSNINIEGKPQIKENICTHKGPLRKKDQLNQTMNLKQIFYHKLSGRTSHNGNREPNIFPTSWT